MRPAPPVMYSEDRGDESDLLPWNDSARPSPVPPRPTKAPGHLGVLSAALSYWSFLRFRRNVSGCGADFGMRESEGVVAATLSDHKGPAFTQIGGYSS